MVVCVLEAINHFPPHIAFVQCFITAAESNWAELVWIIAEGIHGNDPGPRKMSSEIKNQSWLCKYFIPNKQIPCDFKGDHGQDLKLSYMKDKVSSGRLTDHAFLVVIHIFLTRIQWTIIRIPLLFYQRYFLWKEITRKTTAKREWKPSYHVGSHHPLLLICTSIFAVNYGICTKNNYSSPGPFSWNYLTQNKQKIKNTVSPPHFRHWKLLFQYTRALGTVHL